MAVVISTSFQKISYHCTDCIANQYEWISIQKEPNAANYLIIMDIYLVILYLHVGCGFLAFIFGGIASFATKGSKSHIKSGRGFGIAMGLAAIFAIVLSFLKPNPFLFGIGLFTVYLISSGYSWVSRIPVKDKLHRAKFIGAFGIVAAAYMLFTSVGDGGYNPVLIVFGLLLAAFSLFDVIRSPKPENFIRLHGGRMGGAFIAAITAFSLTNFDGLVPNIWLWFIPTVIGTPLITLSIRKYYGRKQDRKAKAD